MLPAPARRQDDHHYVGHRILQHWGVAAVAAGNTAPTGRRTRPRREASRRVPPASAVRHRAVPREAPSAQQAPTTSMAPSLTTTSGQAMCSRSRDRRLPWHRRRPTSCAVAERRLHLTSATRRPITLADGELPDRGRGRRDRPPRTFSPPPPTSSPHRPSGRFRAGRAGRRSGRVDLFTGRRTLGSSARPTGSVVPRPRATSRTPIAAIAPSSASCYRGGLTRSDLASDGPSPTHRVLTPSPDAGDVPRGLLRRRRRRQDGSVDAPRGPPIGSSRPTSDVAGSHRLRQPRGYPDGGYPARGDDFRRLVLARLTGAPS